MIQRIEFENHFSARVVEIIFPDGFKVTTPEELEELKAAWKANLKSWHSPYTCLFDLRNFTLSQDMQNEFQKLIKFFGNFFMRKIIGFCDEASPSLSSHGEGPLSSHGEEPLSSHGEEPLSSRGLTAGSSNVGFEILSGYEKAAAAAGLSKEGKLSRNLDDLRGRISIDNDFNAHVMEINFLGDTHFETKEDVEILRSKLKNILRLWHSPYSILINCVNCTFSEHAKEEFSKLEKFLKGFFCKKILGYAPKADKQTYPFEMVRSRHLAAAQLENEGLQSGAVANCSTQKSSK